MEKLFGKNAVFYSLTFFTVVVADLITKKFAEMYLSHRDVTILPFLHLVLVYNKGVAFGFLSDAPDFVRVPLVLITPVIAFFITFLYSIRKPDQRTSIIMGMIGGGAIGNLYDRFFLGYVRDFIYLSYGKLSWPAFNLADAAISVSIFLLLINSTLGASGKRG
ncbi:MAG: signal peptidase II [Aquificaceae bacterium]